MHCLLATHAYFSFPDVTAGASDMDVDSHHQPLIQKQKEIPPLDIKKISRSYGNCKKKIGNFYIKYKYQFQLTVQADFTV